MARIELKLPKGVESIGCLRTTEDPWQLDEDMFQVKLPGDIRIHVGWYPDLDPEGEYQLRVFQCRWENKLEPDFVSREVSDIEQGIYDRVDRYLLPVRFSGFGAADAITDAAPRAVPLIDHTKAYGDVAFLAVAPWPSRPTGVVSIKSHAYPT